MMKLITDLRIRPQLKVFSDLYIHRPALRVCHSSWRPRTDTQGEAVCCRRRRVLPPRFVSRAGEKPNKRGQTGSLSSAASGEQAAPL